MDTKHPSGDRSLTAAAIAGGLTDEQRDDIFDLEDVLRPPGWAHEIPGLVDADYSYENGWVDCSGWTDLGNAVRALVLAREG
jgi:hypothetical protein